MPTLGSRGLIRSSVLLVVALAGLAGCGGGVGRRRDCSGKAGHVVVFTDKTLSSAFATDSILSIGYALDKVLPLFATALR